MPSPWIALVLAMAAYRLTRLGGWDDFPLAVRVRGWVTGLRWVPTEPTAGVYSKAEYDELLNARDQADVALPGKQPPSEVEAVRPAYDRPTLAHMVACPFCLGFHISLAVVVAWFVWHPVMYGMLPFAVSGFVGLVSKQLDP